MIKKIKMLQVISNIGIMSVLCELFDLTCMRFF